MLNKRAKERLAKLADFIEKVVPSQHFNMEIFVEGDCKVLKEVAKTGKPQKEKDRDCGSACCAIGWLPALFPRSFKWKDNNDLNDYFDIIHKESGKEAFEGAEEFFSINDDQSQYLFDPWSYQAGRNGNKIRKSTVINRLRRFVKEDGRVHELKD